MYHKRRVEREILQFVNLDIMRSENSEKKLLKIWLISNIWATFSKVRVSLEAGRGRCPQLLPHRDQADGGEVHRDPGIHREGTEPSLIVPSALFHGEC